MLALFVIGAFGGIGAWGVIAVLRVERLTEAQRLIAAGLILLVLSLLAMWVIFVWSAYWDSYSLPPSLRAGLRCRASTRNCGIHA
jgi:hypothetical protein